MPQAKAVDSTAKSLKANTEDVNNPDYCQSPATDEVPSHLAAKMHQEYPVKPPVQELNEQLSTDTPTGYAAHDPSIDLDAAQLKTIKPSNTDAYNEAKNRVKEDDKTKAKAK